MAQQTNLTAVEWFWIHLPEKISKEYFDLFEQAKAMEKEQIMKAVNRGYDEGCKFPGDMTLKNAEQYYNDTYTQGSE